MTELMNTNRTPFEQAIDSVHRKLLSGPIDVILEGLEWASAEAAKVGNPHANELAELAERLRPGLEALNEVEGRFVEMFFPEEA
jgi:hypothetical protein